MFMKAGNTIKAAMFDFGGVLADEGFRNGLYDIASENRMDPEKFAFQARELLYSTGYLTGECDEHAYWEALRTHTGIAGDDRNLRNTILKGFILREWMFNEVGKLKRDGVRLFILSDQTNWLDELEEKHHFFYLFEKVFNSYHTGKSKRDRSVFNDVLAYMDLPAETVVFIDDTYDHTLRAHDVGMKTIWYQGREDFLERMNRFLAAPEGQG